MPIAYAQAHGYPVIRVLELDVADPSALVTNSGWWLSPKTLYFSDHSSLRDSTSTTDTEYIPSVMMWGVIDTTAPDIQSALGTLADTTVTLSNARVPPQHIQPPGRSGMTVQPNGDELRLSDLMRHYEFLNAAARIKLIFFTGASRDQSVGANYSAVTLFNGFVAGVSTEYATIVLDLVSDIKQRASVFCKRAITAPAFEESRAMVIPVAYGGVELHENERTVAGGAFLNKEMLVIRGKAQGYPVLPYQRDVTTGTKVRLVWNDCQGVNAGWTTQGQFDPGPGPERDAGSQSAGFLFSNNTDSKSVSIFYEEATAGTTAGYWGFENPASPTELTVLYKDYLLADTYIPGYRAYGSTGVTDSHKALDQNERTFALLNVGTLSNYIDLAISPSNSLGTVQWTSNAVGAWIALAKNAASLGAPIVKFGIYDTGAAAFIGTPASLDAGDLAVSTVYRQDGTDVNGNSAAISANGTVAYTDIGDIKSWGWNKNNNELVIRVIVTTAGNSADIKIIGAGLKIKHDLREHTGYKPYGGIEYGRPPGSPIPVYYSKVSRTYRERGLPALLMSASNMTLDDGSDTISGGFGSGNKSGMHNPAHVCAHLIVKWAQDSGASDLNLVGTGTTDSTAFGSFRHAAADLDAWLDDVTGAGSENWRSVMSVTSQTTLADSLGSVTAHCPMMVYKDHVSNVYRAVVYPSGSPNSWLRFKQSDGTTNVAFHWNHPTSSNYGKPYSLDTVSFHFTDDAEVYNDFSILYRYIEGNREYQRSVRVNSDGYAVYDYTAGADVSSGDTLGGNLVTDCTNSETRYGARMTMPAVEADTIFRGETATALLSYLVTRYKQRRLMATGRVYLEGYDLKIGHVFSFDNSLNRYMTPPEYNTLNWADLNFMVTRVSHVPNATGYVVEFTAERLY